MNNQEFDRVVGKKGRSIKRGVAIAVILILSAATLVFLDYYFRIKCEQKVNVFWICAIVCAALMIINILSALHSYKKAESLYKDNIVLKVFKNNHMLYWAKQSENSSQYNISYNEFQRARFVEKREIVSYEGTNLVVGLINGTMVRSVDVLCKKKQGDTVLFSGRIYSVNMPTFNPKLTITITEQGVYFNDSTELDEFEIEDEDFTNRFNTFVSDAELAKPYFKPFLIETILSIESALKGRLIINIVDKKLYVGVFDNEVRFEYGTATKIKGVQVQVEREMESAAKVIKLAEAIVR